MDRDSLEWTGFLEKIVEAVALGEEGIEVRNTLVNRRPHRYPSEAEIEQIHRAHRHWKASRITNAEYCDIVVRMLHDLSNENPNKQLLLAMTEALSEREQDGAAAVSQGKVIGVKAVTAMVEHLQKAGIFLREDQMVRKRRAEDGTWIQVFCLCGQLLYRLRVEPAESPSIERSGSCPQCHLDYEALVIQWKGGARG